LVASAFIRRGFGDEFLERLVGPLVDGCIVGDVNQVSLSFVYPELQRLYDEDSNLMTKAVKVLNIINRFEPAAFRWGMATLPGVLGKRLGLAVRTHTTVESIERCPEGGFLVRTESASDSVICDAVVLATPAWTSAQLISNLSTELTTRLINLPYTSLATVNLSYRKDAFKTPFPQKGLFLTRDMGNKALSIIPTSLLFRKRAPKGEILLTAFCGGDAHPEVMECDDAVLATNVQSILEKTCGISEEPQFVSVSRINQMIPQFNVGHGETINEIEDAINDIPGIYLTGGYFRGPSLSSSIDHATDVVRKAIENLKAHVACGQRLV